MCDLSETILNTLRLLWGTDYIMTVYHKQFHKKVCSDWGLKTRETIYKEEKQAENRHRRKTVERQGTGNTFAKSRLTAEEIFKED
jgi:hypothetical protein